MGTSKANSAKKDQKSSKKSGKVAKKNDKTTKKSTKSSTKLAKASGKSMKINNKNNKKSNTKKTQKSANKSGKKANKGKVNKASKASGKNTKKAPKTAKTNQKADNLVFLWFIWAFLIIVVFGGLYWVIIAIVSPKRPAEIRTNLNSKEQILVFDTKGEKVIGTLPFGAKALADYKVKGAELGYKQMNKQIVPTLSPTDLTEYTKKAKEIKLPECERTCYEPANIFLFPPDYIK